MKNESFREVPIAEVLQIIQKARETVEARKIREWGQEVLRSKEYFENREKSRWLVRFGILTPKTFKFSEVAKILKEDFEFLGQSTHGKIFNWRYSTIEGVLDKIEKLCLVTKEKPTIFLNSDDAEYLYGWGVKPFQNQK